MHKGLIMRVVVSLLVLACFGYNLLDSLHPAGVLPLTLEPLDDRPLVQNIAAREGVALPAGIQAGDRMDVSVQSLGTRLMLYSGSVMLRPGDRYDLVVERNGFTATAAIVTVPRPKGDAGSLMSETGRQFVVLLLLVLGLVTLWWGHDWTAWGLSLFGNLCVVGFALRQPLPPSVAPAAWMAQIYVLLPLAIFGLYVTAWAYVRDSISPGVRRLHHVFFALSVLAFWWFQLRGFGNAMGWWFNPLGAWALLLVPFVFGAFFMPMEVLLLGYRRVEIALKANLRWVIWSLVLMLGSGFIGGMISAWVADSLGGIVNTISNVLSTLGLAGLLYGVLFRRVVPLSFFVHRGLVYGSTIAVVVVVFAVAEALLSQTALGDNATLLVSVAVSLALGLTLDQIHKYIGGAIERLLFRRKHVAANALREFARHSAFMEDRDRLLDGALKLISTHVQPDGVAFYDRVEDGYECIGQHGDKFPQHVHVDDRVFVALRAGAKDTKLQDLESTLGGDGHVFPMAVRGVLQGALACGPRVERYTLDELHLLAGVAHAVGVSWFALQSHDGDTLLKALANGEVDPQAARDSARRILNLSAKGNASA